MREANIHTGLLENLNRDLESAPPQKTVLIYIITYRISISYVQQLAEEEQICTSYHTISHVVKQIQHTLIGRKN
jgi:hypothetical protein